MNWLFSITLAVVIVLLNCDVASIGFLTDDYWLLANASQGGLHFFSSWTPESSFYRPLVMLTFLLNLSLSSHPNGFHLFNLAVHLANCVLLYWICILSMRLPNQQDKLSHKTLTTLAFGVSLVFSVHPANAHDVVWISGRTDLVACLFSLITLAFCLRGIAGNHKMFFRMLSGGFFVFALASKEIAVIVPFVAMFVAAQHEIQSQALLRLHMDWRKVADRSIRHTFHLFVLDLFYVCFRLILVPYTEGRLDWSIRPFSEHVVFIIKSFYLYLSPLDPLSSFYRFKESPVIFLFIACFLFGAVLYIIRPTLIRQRLFIVYTVAAAGSAIISISLNAYHGIISQRLMYMPIAMLFVVSLPLVTFLLGEIKGDWKRVFTLGFLFAAIILVYAIFYRSTVRGWKKASELEQSLAKEMVKEIDDISRPIVVLSYPFRFNQIFVSGAMPNLLYYYEQGTFGTFQNVKTGLQVIGTTFDAVLKGVTIQHGREGSLRFIASSKDVNQFIYIDKSGNDLKEGVPPLDVVPGEKIYNSLLIATVLRTNEINRATEVEVEIRDSLFYLQAQVLAFENGHMRRIR